MKIRIRGNSVRFRLTKPEVSKLSNEGYFEEKTEFDTIQLIYAIKASSRYKNLHASFNGNSILIYVPNVLLKDWDSNEKVGFYHDQKTENGKTLILAIEKDFVCLDEIIEDQADSYPNPRAIK
tara:strand:+ start:844 stop:1212 length:369 start_codon:yes stop_codon:yes gene_type:complete